MDFCKMKPILFNTDMVRAILDGRKTVTRRVVKPQPKGRIAYACMGYRYGTWGYPDKNAWKYWDDESYKRPDGIATEELGRRWTPPCHTGDILYVRETWCDPSGTGWPIIYKAALPMHWNADETEHGETIDLRDEDVKWLPSIHMPKWAARLFLRVTDVRVERLQDIDDYGVLAEGLGVGDPFDELWDTTIKPADLPIYGWAANPWVWVIEFERISKEAG